jgi:diguanylate cyclase (GGDEF)-like protein
MLKAMMEAQGYEVVLASNGYEAQHIIEGDDPPRLAILDWFMPGIGGIELCEIIRARKQDYIYTILLSVADQTSDVLKGFELGADDYLCKPFKESELRARVAVGERIIRSRDALLESREALEFEASHDPLLRLWNRSSIIDLLGTELGRAKRLKTTLSIFFVDLDHFKEVNDTYGHLAGDDVLRSATGKMSSAVREYDHVGRFGGDEFLVVLPNCTAEAAWEVAERVREHIGADPIVVPPMLVKITASIGLSEWCPGQEISDLLYRADVALYRAKQNGRNCVEIENISDASSGATSPN